MLWNSNICDISEHKAKHRKGLSEHYMKYP